MTEYKVGPLLSTFKITHGHRKVFVSGEESAPRRCGGQGDVLSGAAATFAAWAACYRKGYWR